MFIVMTEQEANQVRGNYGETYLDPRYVDVDKYILGLHVLDDDTLLDIRGFLETLPQEDVTLPEAVM